MKSRPIPRISSRKQPRQARSERLVADILEAAVRVLASGGARRFTTARVAERAGVSVGSLYQYFPNKEAILFRLQTDEWRMTSNMINQILADTTLAPFARLRSVVRAFVQSECAEAELRVALGDAAPLYRDVPETLEYRKAGMRRVVQFMRETACGRLLAPTSASRSFRTSIRRTMRTSSTSRPARSSRRTCVASSRAAFEARGRRLRRPRQRQRQARREARRGADRFRLWRSARPRVRRCPAPPRANPGCGARFA